METMDWEEIELPAGRMPGVGHVTRALRLFRSPAPGGWLVMAASGQVGVHPAITFCPSDSVGSPGGPGAWCEWEEIGAPTESRGGPRIFRVALPTGWLVLATLEAMGVRQALLFVPDAGHHWSLTEWPDPSIWQEVTLPAGKLPGVGNRLRYLRLFSTSVPDGWMLLASGEGSAAAPSLTLYTDPEHRWSPAAA